MTKERNTRIESPTIIAILVVALAAVFTGGCCVTESLQGRFRSERLVGWWKMDETAGTVVADSSGNHLDGAIIGQPAWSPAGKIGGALTLHGSDGYVNLGNPAALNITGAMTITAWLKYDPSEHAWESIIAKGNNAWRLCRKNRNALNDGIDTVVWAANGLMAREIYGVTDIGDQKWRHVAAVYDPDYVNPVGPRGRVFIYIDGVEDNSGPCYGKIDTSKYDVYIGANQEVADKRHLYTVLNGAIDDVRIYNYALSPAAITDIYSEKR